MRWKLLVGNVAAVILMGILAWVLVRSRASEALVTDLEPSVQRSTALLEAVRTQDGDQLIDAVESTSHGPDLAAVFAIGTDSERRDAAFTFAEGAARQIGSQIPRRGRPAELVALVGSDGKVIGRNSERRLDADRNVGTEFPAVTAAMAGPQGRTVRDFIRYGEQGWLEIVAVPVLQNDRVLGALLVGYSVADSAARSDAQRVGVDVGYLFRENDRYTVQSLSVGQQTEKEQLRAWANGQGAGLQAMFRGRQRMTITLGDSQFLAMVMPMPGAFTPQNAGAVVLRSITAAQAPAQDVAFPVILAMLLGLVIVVGYNLALSRYYERPIEEIEESLLKIINGDRNHRINVEHPELGGIVYRVNQLISELTGEEESSDNPGGNGPSGA